MSVGPPPLAWMKAPRASVCAASNLGSLRAAWASLRAAGIRPEETWKYTAASPTPMRLGPRSCTPCKFAPWHVMHDVSYSCLPSRIRAAESSLAVATCGAGVNAEARKPALINPIINTSAPVTRRRIFRWRRDFAAFAELSDAGGGDELICIPLVCRDGTGRQGLPGAYS